MSVPRCTTRRLLRLASVLAAMAVIGCATDDVGPTATQIGSVVQVVISPAELNLPVGGVGRLTARAIDAAGQTVAESFVWTSTNPDVAAVGADGTIIALSQGVTVASAATRSHLARVSVVVRPLSSLPGNIAFARMRDFSSDVLVYSFADRIPRSLPRSGDFAFVAAPAWSPDGRSLALEVISSFGEPSEDGVRHVTDVFLLSAAGSLELPWRALTADGRSQSPAWSPDGSRIAYIGPATTPSAVHIYIVEARGGEPVALTRTEGSYGSPRWSPDGTRIAFFDGNVGNGDIFTVNLDGSVLNNVTRNPAFDGDPDWSPDGSRLAFVSDRASSLADYARDVFIVDRNGESTSQLTSMNGWSGGPVWSPDGRYVAFSQLSSRRVPAGLHVVSADGSFVVRLTTTPDGAVDASPTWGRAAEGSIGALPVIGPAHASVESAGSAATIRFGQLDVGSPFPPLALHDGSAHAKDNLVPRTVVIDAGGTVTFEVPAGAHQIAIYAPGTAPTDIDTSALRALCPGPAARLIDDPTNRVALITGACGIAWQAQYTFDTAGRYLVICAFLPHFQVGMYGWVEVRDRD